ncbi:MAG: hypothetical protein Q9196_001128 [Gyalolechia fulgens]
MTAYGFKTTAEEIAGDCKSVIKDKVILTTGVSPGGIGATFVQVVAQHSPKLLILAGRNTSKCEETAKAIRSESPNTPTRVLELDLGSLAQVRKAAAEVNSYPEPIDVLCNNAGIMATPYTTTTDALESQFAINHVGHFLFTNLIIPKLLAAPNGARVINVSSDGHRLGPVRFDDYGWDNGKTYDRWRAYGQAKSANMLFALELARRLGKKGNGEGLVSLSLHPGVVGSNLVRYMGQKEFKDLRTYFVPRGTIWWRLLMSLNWTEQMDRDLGYTDYWHGFDHLLKNASEGASTHVYAAFEPSLQGHNGAYLADNRVHPSERILPWARDPVSAERLWRLSEELVGQKFGFENEM